MLAKKEIMTYEMKSNLKLLKKEQELFINKIEKIIDFVTKYN